MPGKSAVSACVDRLACEAFADMRGEAADLIDRDDGLRMKGQPIKGLASSNADGWSASLTSAKQHTATVTVFGDGRLYSYDMGYTPAANKLSATTFRAQHAAVIRSGVPLGRHIARVVDWGSDGTSQEVSAVGGLVHAIAEA